MAALSFASGWVLPVAVALMALRVGLAIREWGASGRKWWLFWLWLALVGGIGYGIESRLSM